MTLKGLMIFWGVLFFALAILTVIVAILGAATANRTKKRVSRLFPNAKLHAAGDGTYLAIDSQKKRIAVGRLRGRMSIDCIYTFDQIASVSLNIDGNTISSTNRGSQVAGAAIGALAFGGIGALVGGLSGSSTSVGTIRRISIKIIVDDPSSPFHDITFYEASDTLKGDSKSGIGGWAIDQSQRNTEEFHALLVGAIRMCEQQKLAGQKDTSKPKDVSHITEQIKQLWQLKEIGAITLDEFEKQKLSILNRPDV